MKTAIGSHLGSDGIWRTEWRDDGIAKYCKKDSPVFAGELIKNDKNVVPAVVSAKECIAIKAHRF